MFYLLVIDAAMMVVRRRRLGNEQIRSLSFG
jgi:hypothetical protein